MPDKKNAPELSSEQVAKVIASSAGGDWVFFPEEQMFCYRKDLLIRLEPTGSGKKAHIVRYGNRSLGEVSIAADWEKASRDKVLNEVVVTGDLDVKLQQVEVGSSTKVNNEQRFTPA